MSIKKHLGTNIKCNTALETAAAIRLAQADGLNKFFSLTTLKGHTTVWLSESGPGRKTAFLVKRAGFSNSNYASQDLENDIIWQYAQREVASFPVWIRTFNDFRIEHEAKAALTQANA